MLIPGCNDIGWLNSKWVGSNIFALINLGLSGFLQRNNSAYDFFKEGMPIIYSLRSHQPSPVAGVGGCEGNKLYSIW